MDVLTSLPADFPPTLPSALPTQSTVGGAQRHDHTPPTAAQDQSRGETDLGEETWRGKGNTPNAREEPGLRHSALNRDWLLRASAGTREFRRPSGAEVCLAPSCRNLQAPGAPEPAPPGRGGGVVVDKTGGPGEAESAGQAPALTSSH